MEKTLKTILSWLSGKKSTISGIILTVTGYLGSIGTLNEAQVVLIGTITTLIFGTASIATSKFIYKK